MSFSRQTVAGAFRVELARHGSREVSITNKISMKKIVISTLALSVGVSILMAQDATQPERGPRPGGRPGGPLIEALDANKDGVIDAAEINNAAAALRGLDKNADGQLTAEELRPARPAGGRGPGGPGRPERGNE
jgi:hypothetical protein